MPRNRMTIMVGGEAGQGVESGGAGFAKALARGGLHVFGLPDFMSRIRGGHNFYLVRVAEEPLWAHEDDVHLLLAFNRDTVDLHLHEVVPGGGIIHDSAVKVDPALLAKRGVQDFEMPLVKIAEEIGGHRIMMNTAAIGATAGITGYEFERVADIILTNFKRKGQEIAENNLKVARHAYDLAAERYSGSFDWKLAQVPGAPQRMLINGNQALAMGALAAGCRFISTYPMTPGSTITEWLAAHAAKFGVVQKQTEDEIAALLMAIGAAHAGARAMTATSGGGFCLMVEALGLAGMTETPVVIVDAQRGGPSTGLPTRTEQSDLQFVLHASHGEFPRIVLAPGTIEQCFDAGVRSFNLAEKYQTPVIVLTDLHQAFAVRTVDKDAFDIAGRTIDRGELIPWDRVNGQGADYQRHQPTESGISPRILPGSEQAVYITTGDEHTRSGFITEDADDRNEQMEKRMRKLEGAKRDVVQPAWYGPATADVTLVGWGSAYGALREATDLLNAEGVPTNLLHFVDVFPLDEDLVTAEIGRIRRMVVVEQNFTGQLANLLRVYTGRKADVQLNKYDGRAFSARWVVERVKAKIGVAAHA